MKTFFSFSQRRHCYAANCQHWNIIPIWLAEQFNISNTLLHITNIKKYKSTCTQYQQHGNCWLHVHTADTNNEKIFNNPTALHPSPTPIPLCVCVCVVGAVAFTWLFVFFFNFSNTRKYSINNNIIISLLNKTYNGLSVCVCVYVVDDDDDWWHMMRETRWMGEFDELPWFSWFLLSLLIAHRIFTHAHCANTQSDSSFPLLSNAFSRAHTAKLVV